MSEECFHEECNRTDESPCRYQDYTSETAMEEIEKLQDRILELQDEIEYIEKVVAGMPLRVKPNLNPWDWRK